MIALANGNLGQIRPKNVLKCACVVGPPEESSPQVVSISSTQATERTLIRLELNLLQGAEMLGQVETRSANLWIPEK